VGRELLLYPLQQGPGAVIVLFRLGRGQVHGKSVQMVKEDLANLFVRGASWPEVQWCAAGDTRDVAERRRTKLYVLGHQESRPGPQILEELVQLPVQCMVPRDLPVGLLDLAHHVEDLAQRSVEGDDGIVRW
jgi:hypothetical protein